MNYLNNYNHDRPTKLIKIEAAARQAIKEGARYRATGPNPLNRIKINKIFIFKEFWESPATFSLSEHLFDLPRFLFFAYECLQ